MRPPLPDPVLPLEPTMRILILVLAILLGLLSIVAGGAKAARLPEELAFLAGFGFTPGMTAAFGVVQVPGSLLMLVPRTRRPGAAVCALGFGLSTVLLALDGNRAFAAASAVPVILAGMVASRKTAMQETPDE